MKYILSLFLLTIGYYSLAQHKQLNYEIKKIDSLIEYNRLDIAWKKTQTLQKLFAEQYDHKQYLEKKLKVQFQQAVIQDKKFNHGDALPILLDVVQVSEKNNFDRLTVQASILIAFIHEKADNLDLAHQYLNKAFKLCKKNQFDDLYSTLYIRYGFIHRYMVQNPNIPKEQLKRLKLIIAKGSMDSAIYYADKAILYAQKYNNSYDLNEAYLSKAIFLGNHRFEEQIKLYSKTKPYWKKTNNYLLYGMMNRNISRILLMEGDLTEALKFNDSAYQYYDKITLFYKHWLPLQRSEIYEALGNTDSALHYLKIAKALDEEQHQSQEMTTAKKLEEQFQNEKKEATIKAKNQQMLLIACILIVILLATLLLVRKNRQINSQNRVISSQLIDLSRILEQKQVLLSELQHRVKNNLQHVISILEIQKESVNFNNIEELIRGNQNRIHSMALLHKKLNVTDHTNEVDLQRYITELAELVKESYDNNKKEVHLNTQFDNATLTLEKALPLGLIIVELVSNSMKHAFGKRSIGIINIQFNYDKKKALHTLVYTDSGSGYDFHRVASKGLGNEIIKGLLDQLDARVESRNDNGFELTIQF